MAASLSVVIITHNEEHNIAACLESVAFAQEWIVLDSGSTDATVEIARKFGAKVYQSQQWPGYGIQKNTALGWATQSWVLSLDADERVSAELAKQIMAIVSGTHAHADPVAYAIPRLTQFCGHWIRHCGWTPDYVTRLFLRKAGEFSPDLVHERLVLQYGHSTKLSYPLLHFSYSDAKQVFHKLEKYSMAWATQRYEQGQRAGILRAVASAGITFLRTYVLRLGFLDGSAGLAVCIMQAQQAYGKYFALYCLQAKKMQQKTYNPKSQ